MQAVAKLGELPLTEIPDIKKTVPLGLSREQAQFLQEFFKLLQATVHAWDTQFNDVERGIVANLQHCLAAEEEACEEEYRLKAEDAMFSSSFVITGIDDLMNRRMKVLWTMQEMADKEAGQATPVSLIRPFNLLDARQLSFTKERHLKYVTSTESPENRNKSQMTLKKLTNIELRQRYLDICRKRLLGTAAQHNYLPLAPAVYAAHDISWEQLAFEWLETRYDAIYHPEYTQEEGTAAKPASDSVLLGLLYRWSQTTFLASTCDICFLFEEQREQWKRGVKALPDMDIKTIVKELQSIKESLEKGRMTWCAAPQKRDEWRQFLNCWRLLKESLVELKQIMEAHKAALAVASMLSPKKTTPPASPARALPAIQSPKAPLAPLSNRPASLDLRQDFGSSPRLTVASPRRLLFSPRMGPESESAGSPRSRASTGASRNTNEPQMAAISSSSTGRTPPIPIPPLKNAARVFPGFAEPHSPDSGQSPGRVRKGSGTLTTLLKRVDSQFHLKMQSPRKANKLLTNFCAAIEAQIAILNRIETAILPTLSSAGQPPAASASQAAVSSKTTLIFDPEPSATKNAALLLEVLLFAEQMCCELCEQFDLRKPLQFVLDFNQELQKQQMKEDQDILGKIQDKQKEFWEQNRLLLRYHQELFECYKRLKPQDQAIEMWQNVVNKNQSFLDFHKMAFPQSSHAQKPESKEIEQLLNRWKDVCKENKLFTEHYKEQPPKPKLTLEEQMEEVVERLLDLWANEAFEFQRKYALQKGYSIRRTIQLLEEDLRTPRPGRALQVMCNRKRFTEEAVTMTSEELISSIHAKSLLSLLKLHLGVGTINRETPEYEYVGSWLSYVKQRAAPFKAKVPFLSEQCKEEKKIRFTFPVSQADRAKELSSLTPEERLYLEGSELADLYAMSQQLREPLSEHQSFGPIQGGPQPLDKMFERLGAIQEVAGKLKAEKSELLAQQEDVWDQYVAQKGTDERIQQKILRDNLCKGTELVVRYLGNLAALMKARSKGNKGGSQIKAEKLNKRRSNFEPTNLRASLGQIFGMSKSAETEALAIPPEKLRRKIIKRILLTLPPLANCIFTLPPPGTRKK